jgi:wyosine [tRNA(Phe)-imidazoG37] synthetase (radical SAM superfamily)
MTIPLQKKIIYGPVNSRRLGLSLGINLMPFTYKMCSFNCVYCQYGWTKKKTADPQKINSELPAITTVIENIETAVKSDLDFSYLTFSGNGEPTLHPRFPEIVKEAVNIRNRFRPKIKIALLSNCSGILNTKVVSIIPMIDFPFFKLDAGTEKKFREINRPEKGIFFRQIMENLRNLRKIYIQTIFFDGSPLNISADDINAWHFQIRAIQPRQVHIYSLDRPFPHRKIKPILRAHLNELALKGSRATGVEIKAFS